ncbi:glycosyltransferase family 4 protein [Aliiruegeria lutimaris]|uniref:glycosyltransferase family 4 protein n=1 Tax=Aliiruegeria lutimaris TaxID=571298 RepID=UPI001480D333|nr:glycosyltransferase [Aliiruegeria lutimaris]
MRQISSYFGWHLLVLVVVSFCICAVIVLIKDRLPRLSGRVHDLNVVQTVHSRQTPRVGGLAIFGTLALSELFAPMSISEQYGKFVIAAGLLFMVGLFEDLGFHVSPRKRLLAAAGASLLVISYLGVWLPRADIPGLDAVINHWAVGIPLTVLVTAGIANGFNLIDGVNGLASMAAIISAVAMTIIADLAEFFVMGHLAIMLAAGILGFFVLNFPSGLIFLGDAGAYTLGFVLSWYGIAILLNAPEVSPWAILLVLFLPVADTLLAIYRRSRRNADAMAPDKLHMHQIVMRTLEICFLGRKRRKIANPLSTLVLAPFTIAPPICGVMYWDQKIMSFAAVVGFGFLFLISYAAMPRFIRWYCSTIRSDAMTNRSTK